MPRYNDGTHEQMNLILKKEEMQALRVQAEKLGTDRTGYIKMIVKVDAATSMMQVLQHREAYEREPIETYGVKPTIKKLKGDK